jgi:hypothetical protein
MQDNTPDNANDQNQFPGYPHYDAKEDIMDKRNEAQKVSTDPNDMGPNARTESMEQRTAPAGDLQNATDETTEADVTPEDLQMLSAAFQSRDMDDMDPEEAKLDETDEDGDPLNEPRSTYNQTGADLDVPGSETDDANENIGEEDEENNYYSLGGDNHESLEEDPSV